MQLLKSETCNLEAQKSLVLANEISYLGSLLYIFYISINVWKTECRFSVLTPQPCCGSTDSRYPETF